MTPVRLLTIIMLAMLAACAEPSDMAERESFSRPETHVDYAVDLTGVSDDRVRDLMEQALAVFRQQEKGAQSVAFLRRRAQGDRETAQKILRSFGWYEAKVAVDVIPPEEGEPDALAQVAIRVDEGRRYELAGHSFTLVEGGVATPSSPDAAALGSPVGGPATAREILNAEVAAVAQLRAGGRPYARRLGRDSVADPEAAIILVDTTIAVGAAYVFGDARYVGADNVRREYLETYRTWAPGQPADPARLDAFQNALVATGLFQGVSAAFPEDAPAAGVVPVVVSLEEAPPRTVSGGVRYDTEAGPAVRGGFEHRNLFGANETLTLEALAGLEIQSLGGEYRQPQWREAGQDLVWAAELRRVDDEAYDELGATFGVGVERELSADVTVGAGLVAELSRTKTATETETAKLFGLPVFVAYDSSDDLLDPSKGVRARAAATPFAGYQGETAVSFLILDASAAAYFDISGSKDHILAVRGRLAAIPSGDIDVISPARRLYAGGGGSVRGYGERFISPLDGEGEPTGGRSAIEAGAEIRSRITEVVGAAAFVEGGAVSETIYPTFNEGFLVAVGGGLRYFSPVGPIRFDVGVPVNGRDADDDFQIYISIGQAF